MKNSLSKKRLILLALAATAVAGVAAVQAGAIGSGLPIRGTNTFCLTSDAARTLTAHKVEVTPIAPATASGNCVTMSGAGTLAPNVTTGQGTLTGGMRFTGGGHRLDVTNVQGHISLGKGSTTADLAQDGGPVKNVDFLHWPISLSRVSMTPTTASMRNNPVTLTPQGTAAFTRAFGASPTPGNGPLWLYEGKGELSNPFAGPAKS